MCLLLCHDKRSCELDPNMNQMWVVSVFRAICECSLSPGLEEPIKLLSWLRVLACIFLVLLIWANDFAWSWLLWASATLCAQVFLRRVQIGILFPYKSGRSDDSFWLVVAIGIISSMHTCKHQVLTLQHANSSRWLLFQSRQWWLNGGNMQQTVPLGPDNVCD